MLDTRDLIEKREKLINEVLESFNETFFMETTSISEIELFFNDEASGNITDEEKQDFRDEWEMELEWIEEINDVEAEIGTEFNYGCTLIENDEFEDHCKDMVEDCGYISNDLPSWIVIDWSATANNM